MATPGVCPRPTPGDGVQTVFPDRTVCPIRLLPPSLQYTYRAKPHRALGQGVAGNARSGANWPLAPRTDRETRRLVQGLVCPISAAARRHPDRAMGTPGGRNALICIRVAGVHCRPSQPGLRHTHRPYLDCPQPMPGEPGGMVPALLGHLVYNERRSPIISRPCQLKKELISCRYARLCRSPFCWCSSY